MGKITNDFSWSASRDKTFRQCERAYYYQYYGAWGGWENDAPERTRKLYVLKNIKTLPMWGGSIVHEVIAEALNRYARGGKGIKVGELQARARQKLRQGWVEAVSREWLTSPKKTNLHGLYYGNGKTLPREKTEHIKEKIYQSLAAFANSAVLQEILSVPYMSWKPVDVLDSFLLHDLKIWCAVDFAYTDAKGILHIVDWKTGAENDGLKTQLACYALYAGERWMAPLDSVRLYGIFLNENARVSEYEVSPEDFIDAQDDILSSADDMLAKLDDVNTNRAKEEESFEICNNGRICYNCNFREICPGFAAVAEAPA